MALFVRSGPGKTPPMGSIGPPLGRSGSGKTPPGGAVVSLLFFPLPIPPTRTTGFARNLLTLPRLLHSPFPTSVDQSEKVFPLPPYLHSLPEKATPSGSSGL